MRPVSFSAFDAVDMLTPAAAATSWIVIRPFFPPAISTAFSRIFREKTFSLSVRQVRKGFLIQILFLAERRLRQDPQTKTSGP
jgi:hypothetical protein